MNHIKTSKKRGARFIIFSKTLQSEN